MPSTLENNFNPYLRERLSILKFCDKHNFKSVNREEKIILPHGMSITIEYSKVRLFFYYDSKWVGSIRNDDPDFDEKLLRLFRAYSTKAREIKEG